MFCIAVSIAEHGEMPWLIVMHDEIAWFIVVHGEIAWFILILVKYLDKLVSMVK